MYKVYKDPEGKRYLEDPTSHHTSTIQKTVTISSETEESYKKRIENLNEEIKVLSDELEKVLLIWLSLLKVVSYLFLVVQKWPD